MFLPADVDVTRDIVTRERIHRKRGTILRSSGKVVTTDHTLSLKSCDVIAMSSTLPVL